MGHGKGLESFIIRYTDNGEGWHGDGHKGSAGKLGVLRQVRWQGLVVRDGVQKTRAGT